MSKIYNKIRSAAAQLSQRYKPSLAFAKYVLIASAAVTLSLMGARQLGILEPVELSAYDQMLRWRPEEQPDSRLLVVGITEADIQKLKQWPISDRKIVEILQKLQKMQPALIGLDVLRDVPLGDGREELTKLLQKKRSNYRGMFSHRRKPGQSRFSACAGAGTKPGGICRFRSRSGWHTPQGYIIYETAEN